MQPIENQQVRALGVLGILEDLREGDVRREIARERQALVDDPEVVVGDLDAIGIITPDLHRAKKLVKGLLQVRHPSAVRPFPDPADKNLQHVQGQLPAQNVLRQLPLLLGADVIGCDAHGLGEVGWYLLFTGELCHHLLHATAPLGVPPNPMGDQRPGEFLGLRRVPRGLLEQLLRWFELEGGIDLEKVGHAGEPPSFELPDLVLERRCPCCVRTELGDRVGHVAVSY